MPPHYNTERMSVCAFYGFAYNGVYAYTHASQACAPQIDDEGRASVDTNTSLRWIRRLGALLALVLLASLFMPLAVQIARAEGELIAVVNTPRLNVRSGPSAGYSVVATVSQGDVLTLLARDTAGSYAKARLANGIVGWVSTFYIVASGPISSLPVEETVEPWAFVRTGALNLREGPSTSYGILKVLAQGTPLGLLGRNRDASWLQVRVDGMTGWVGSSGVYASVPLSLLPNTAGSAPALPTATPLPVPTTAATPVPGVPTPTPLVPPTATQVPTLTPVFTGPVAVVTTPRLNVRLGPGAGYAIARTITEGDLVGLLGRDSAGSWVLVKLEDGFEGWTSTFYLDSETPFSSLPVVASYEPVGLIITGTANIRSAPSLAADVLTTANYGTRVNLLGRNATTTWLKVRVGGVEGWVGRGLVETSVRAGSLPVLSE